MANNSERVTYTVHNTNSLAFLLQVIVEIHQETGMDECFFTYKGEEVDYQWTDAKGVIRGAISEEEYIARHRISCPQHHPELLPPEL